MENKQKKSFDTVAFFREIKEKLAAKMAGISLKQQKEFMRQVREGKIKMS